jgi:hypothetical protein
MTKPVRFDFDDGVLWGNNDESVKGGVKKSAMSITKTLVQG